MASSPRRFCCSRFAARRRDLVSQRLRQREVLEQGHDIGKRLVERPDVGIGRLEELRAQAVQQRMRGFVGDDIMRRGGEYRPRHRI